MLAEVLSPYKIDKLCFLTHKTDSNFKQAAKALENVEIKSANTFNVPDLVKSDYIFMTKEGLSQLELVLDSRTVNQFRNRKVPNVEGIKRSHDKRTDKYVKNIIRPVLERPNYEKDELPLHLVSESMQSYMDDLRKMQAD